MFTSLTEGKGRKEIPKEVGDEEGGVGGIGCGYLSNIKKNNQSKKEALGALLV
jgi:hypothetical protein